MPAIIINGRIYRSPIKPKPYRKIPQRGKLGKFLRELQKCPEVWDVWYSEEEELIYVIPEDRHMEDTIRKKVLMKHDYKCSNAEGIDSPAVVINGRIYGVFFESPANLSHI